MASLYTQRDRNIYKTWALMAGFLVVVIAVGWGVSWYFNDQIILYAAVAFALFMNISAYWWSDKIALASTRAKPADENEYRELHRIVENLAITAGLPKPRVYVIDDPAPNAFATGRDPKHSAIAVTTGLLARLERVELEGVIAHELSHIDNRDILVMTVAVVLAGFIAIIADIFLRMSLFGGGDRDRMHPAFAVLIVVVIILAPIAAQIIQLAISRKREFLADASGALLTRYPEGLASALQKIASHKAPMHHANHATAHLFISNPFPSTNSTPSADSGQAGSPQAGLRASGGGMQFINKMFATHPPMEERIASLRGTRI
jgi:heat shock protein HtpX